MARRLRVGKIALVALTITLAIVAAGVFPAAARAHVLCIETTNPHGQTVPPAGSTTLPGPRGGQNEDGFYLLTLDQSLDRFRILVVDLGSGTTFGPFVPGTKIKYTQAPGATPSIKKIGSTNGQAGAVQWHITGTGDLQLQTFNLRGNRVRFADGSDTVNCFVPPPPK